MSSGSQFGGVPPGKLQNVRLARSEAGSHIAESKLAFKAWINLKLRVIIIIIIQRCYSN
jgi:hypothetical protein